MLPRACLAAAVVCLSACGVGGLTWNTGCGPPVVRPCEADAGVVDAGMPDCGVTPGSLCATPGASCLFGADCHGPIRLTCQSEPTNCPVSRMKYKTDITYLRAPELQQARDALVALPLATYRYKADGPGGRVHLGFMIDGHEALPAVDAAHDVVDLYGYTSMAVATLKVQQEQIEALQRRLVELEAKCAAGKAH